MCNESIQILLNSATAYAALAQSLRSDGISSWVSYQKQAFQCIEKAKKISKQTKNVQILGFEEEILVA